MHVLIVEDETEMLAMLCVGVEEHGHTVTCACDGMAGLSLATAKTFDVIVLDVLLPGCSGNEVARRLRASPDAMSRHTPILMLTACDAENQVIQGLDTGADYYMTKPFSFLELLARMKSLQRHTLTARSSCMRVDDLIFDPENHLIQRAGKSIDLTRTERTLLACLLRSTGTTVPRQTLLSEVWGDSNPVGNSTLDAFMNLLRNKIDTPFQRKLIQTTRGVGYRIRRPSGESEACQG